VASTGEDIQNIHNCRYKNQSTSGDNQMYIEGAAVNLTFLGTAELPLRIRIGIQDGGSQIVRI